MANGTIGDRGGRHKPVRAGWRYHPYEIGLCGGTAPERSGLAAALCAGPFAGLRVYCAPEPAAATAYEAPCEALESDFALIPCTPGDPMAKIVWMDRERPDGLVEALCFAGLPSACPILPANAAYFTTAQLDAMGAAILRHIAGRTAPLYGLVLAGGKSERMGRDKGAIAYRGEPEARRLFGLASAVCRQTFVSCRDEQSGADHLAGLPVLPDRFLQMGPMGGILSAMTAHPEAAWLVLACDLPLIGDETIRALLAGRQPLKTATAFRGDDGFPEPLCAIYEPKCIHRLLRFLGLGYECPRKVLINSAIALIEAPSAEALINANEPGEYAAALARLQQETGAHG